MSYIKCLYIITYSLVLVNLLLKNHFICTIMQKWYWRLLAFGEKGDNEHKSPEQILNLTEAKEYEIKKIISEIKNII